MTQANLSSLVSSCGKRKSRLAGSQADFVATNTNNMSQGCHESVWLWCLARVLVRAPSGRQRFNVLLALHAITHQLITVTHDSYINAISVCELLEKMAALGLSRPITVVMDNARYQRCRLVLERARQLGIE
jgi:hypothetical protein